MTLRFLSVCSGIEAASLAFVPLGWTAAGFAEIAPFPSALLAARFGSNMPGEALSRNAPPNFGDFTTIDPRAIGRVDVLCGGTPCQAFSIAGRRGSLADARGNLTLAFVRLAHELVAHAGLRTAIWENVPGALSLDDNAFGCFLGELVGADDPLLPGERPRRAKSSTTWRWREAGRKPILDDDGNETGEFVEWAEGHLPRWPRVGMVAGPLGRAAWRVLDAQYFGVPQRRERIVLVADFGNGADPAEVLFEPKGLRGDIAKGRSKREGIAGSLTASSGKRGGVPQADGADNLIPVAFGGNDTRGPIDVSTALNAHGGPSGRLDFESETFIVAPEIAQPPAMAFYANFSAAGHISETLDLAPALKRGEGGGSTIPAVAFDLRGREGGAQFEGPHDTANLRAASGGSSRSYVAEHWAVRRLTPLECERLQGIPDGWTAINRGGVLAADGPRYASIGNSWARPVFAWVGARLDAALRALEEI